MNDLILEEFKKNALFRLDESLRMICIALGKIEDDVLWKLPFSNGIALGSQVLHSCGNMTQYIISSLGEQEDLRERDLEFVVDESKTLDHTIQKLKETVDTSKRTIENATQQQYIKVRMVQGFELSGVGLVLHAVEHFSYHTGQITFWVKQLTNEDLDFYDGKELNTNNS
tara:strand:+ start:86 stop:595 length:510 start_codon:yes stop_codon:yes gene_type:complete